MRSADFYAAERGRRERSLLFGRETRPKVARYEIQRLTAKMAACFMQAFELEDWTPGDDERDEQWWAGLRAAAAVAEIETARERAALRRG